MAQTAIIRRFRSPTTFSLPPPTKPIIPTHFPSLCPREPFPANCRNPGREPKQPEPDETCAAQPRAIAGESPGRSPRGGPIGAPLELLGGKAPPFCGLLGGDFLGFAMPEAGRYNCKKTDGICEGVCGEHASRAALSMSRLKCALRGFDIRALLVLLIGVPILIFIIYVHGQKVTYFLRPIWESPPKPFKMIPHYYHENVSMENLCKLHGWKVRETPRRVFDAVLFSNELDILAIRWNELSPYVSELVLLESNSTFTGLKKPLHFKEHRNQFEFAESRLTYGMIGGRFVKGENPFVEESYQRVALDQLIRIAGITDDDLLIMSDVDEIPSGHTIDLLRWCDNIPEILHLQLRNYLYSFEFLLDDKSWRASVHRYRAGKTRYAHFRQTDDLLADSGWHCSFCFRYISDFVFKMQAYSHVDRIRFKYFLNPARIQDVICRGADLFDMLPEEYTFQEIIAKLGPIPSTYSAVHLPGYLLQNVDRYRYLLPGNCKRERG